MQLIVHVQFSVYHVYKRGHSIKIPYSKVYGANMGPTWGRKDPGEPHGHVGHVNLTIWDVIIAHYSDWFGYGLAVPHCVPIHHIDCSPKWSTNELDWQMSENKCGR